MEARGVQRDDAWTARAALALAGAAVVLIGLFDWLGPDLNFNDDGVYAWNARHFPRIYPDSSALALPQDALARVLTLGHLDFRALRLTELAFVLLAGVAVHRLARRCGADRTWSGIAVLGLVAFPVFAADATTFMSDIPYVAIVLAAMEAALRWLQDRRSPLPFLALVAIATLQRQIGALLPLGFGLALLLTGRAGRRESGWLVAALAAAGGALAVVALLGLTPPTTGGRLSVISPDNAVYALLGVMFLPGVAGLGIAPFLPGLLPGLLRGRGRGRGLAPYAAGVLLWEGFVFAVAAHDVLPGNILTPLGLNWTWPGPGLKPKLFPAPVFLALEGLAVAGVVAFVARLRAAFDGPDRLPSVALAAGAATQFAPLLLLSYHPFDRYYLPVAALLLPLAARAASGQSTRLAAAGMVIAAALLGVYAVGEQDYQAWQSARDVAAREAYRLAPPQEVDAGYEANMVYGEIPAYDATGSTLGAPADPNGRNFSLDGPLHPRYRLEIVPASDPRPGVFYRSAAPGKVAIVPVDGT